MRLRVVALLLVVAVVSWQVDGKKKKTCVDIRGKCVMDSKCPTVFEKENSCPGSLVCCKRPRKGKRKEKRVETSPGEVRQGDAPCIPRSRCDRNNGACFQRDCSADETQLAGACKGNCNCCVEGCVPRSRCNRREGTCVKRECNANERLIKNACKGKNTDCNCCAAAKPCKTFNRCSRLEGNCVKASECDEKSPFQFGCTAGCVCCGAKCPSRPRCDKNNGVCSLNSCAADEREIKGGCKNKDCICCTKTTCRDSKVCKNWGGECKQPEDCEFKDVDTFSCGKKSGCICCTDDCRQRRRCGKRGGTCIEGKCGANTKEIKNGCRKSTCSCCAPDDEGCKTSSECSEKGGSCVKAADCKIDGAKRSGCGKGCLCCVEDTPKGCQPDSKCPGECKENCGQSEFEIKDACSGDCKCCAPFPTSCKASPNTCKGTCKLECNETDLIPSSSCDDVGCSCCLDCSIQTNCSAQRGACRQKCLTGESEFANGCTGFNCKCCTPADVSCPATPATCKGKCMDTRKCDIADRITNSSCTGEFCTCCTDCKELANCTAERGVCRQNCLTKEFEVPNACSGFNCKCCAPPDETCPATPATCKGKCIDTRRCAAADLIANSTCTGEFCTCCLDCTPQANCTAERGVCRQTCLQGESEVTDGCTGTNCKCCSPPDATCPATPATCKGKCVDTRNCETADRIPDSNCTGEFCTCCLDCEIKPACSDRGGSCKLTCEDKEIEIPEGCEGENCKCCMPEDNLAVCTTDASTCQGACVDSLNCDEEVAGSTCNGTNCKCCRDCKPLEVCSNLNGVCKNRPTEECPAGEVVIVDGCTGLDCTCCAGTSGLLSCPASPGCPGRCRDARVCPVVMKDTSCTTPGCTCCLDCKDQSCAQNNGVCRERGTCLDGETESTAGECTGNRCVCCKKSPPTTAETTTPRTTTETFTTTTNSPGRLFCADECGRANLTFPRIVGGQEATPLEYPWIAYLTITGGNFQDVSCAGAIINKDHVVTAAHCFNERELATSVVTIFLAEHDIDSLTETETLTIFASEVLIHPDYKKDGQDTEENDIALLYLGGLISFGTGVQPICIANPEDFSVGQKVIAVGWGLTDFDNKTSGSNVLREVTLDTIDLDECITLYQNAAQRQFVNENMICTLTAGKDACSGDSGGPVIALVDGVWVLLGIVSFGNGCADITAPGVHTNVANYRDWMIEQIGGAFC